jgi:hypothetical protein
MPKLSAPTLAETAKLLGNRLEKLGSIDHHRLVQKRGFHDLDRPSDKFDTDEQLVGLQEIWVFSAAAA